MDLQYLNELNQYPLNQAALRRMEKEGSGPLANLMHLLSLAYLGSPDEAGDGEEGRVLGQWGRPDAGRQAAALAELEESLSQDELEQEPLAKISAQIVLTLKAASSL